MTDKLSKLKDIAAVATVPIIVIITVSFVSMLFVAFGYTWGYYDAYKDHTRQLTFTVTNPTRYL